MSDVAQFADIDYDSDRHEVDRITDNMAILDNYYKEISHVGGISVDQAKALVVECGVEIDDRFPINSFTQLPSKTNLSVAMEGIVSAAGRMLWEMIKKAGELLMKIIRWIRDLFKKCVDRVKSRLKLIGQIQATTKANQKLDEAGINPKSQIAESQNSKIPRQAIEALERAVEIYNTNFSDLTAEIISGNNFAQLIRSLEPVFFSYAPILSDKFALMANTLRRHPTQEASGINQTIFSELNTIATPIPVPAALALIKKSGLTIESGSRVPTFLDAARAVSNEFHAKMDSREFEQIDVESVAQLFVSRGSAIIPPFISAPNEALKIMDTLDKNLKHLQQQQQTFKSDATSEITEAFNRAFRCLMDETNALRLYVSVAEGCSNAQDKLCDDVWRYEQALFMFNRAVVAVVGDGQFVHKLNEVQVELKEDLRRFGG